LLALRSAPRYRFGQVMAGMVGRAWRAGAVAPLLLVCACEVHGLVGSNVTTLSGAEPPDEETTTTGGDSGVVLGSSSSGAAGSSSGAADDDVADTGSGTTEALAFDVGPGDGPEVCLAPLPTVCDRMTDDPWRALGVGCPGSLEATGTFTGNPGALYVHRGMLGTHGEYTPRDGERMVILSTGRAADVPRTHEDLHCVPELCPSTALNPGAPMSALPPPINVRPVDEKLTCAEDPSLVGNGDCSNTLGTQWMAGAGAHDYAELRLTTKVPDSADALVYQFAFFTAEYPTFTGKGSPWNDMYVAWLESEAWTGNISFDEQGNPISINGVFLDYLDAESPLCERTPCEAPELDGFAMDGHAGTRWLETVAPVVPGEEIELIFSIFDLSDAYFDSVVLLDGVHWGCTDLPPLTQPQG
jgi:hypothetical protein